MIRIVKTRLPVWAYVAVGTGILALAAIAELAMGRKLWGNGQFGIWSGNILSEHNSQYLLDPYTFSHITHGILLYGLLRFAAGNLPCGMRGILAVAAESLWEVVENSDMVIQRYREATISLNYYGDSVMNSMFDILACVLGFVLASKLPTRAAVIGVILLEAMLALWIRDGLFLNILMLIHPLKPVHAWQMGR